MSPGTFRRALGAVKDRTSIGIAKVVNSTSLSDLDVAIVKATKHDEYPAEEKYMREILSLTCYSRVFISACVRTLAKRLNKTKNWIVALKTLVLIQRLLSEGDASYESEIFFTTRHGTRLLNLSDFRDKSDPNSWDYSSFVRTYALYLDARLEFRMQTKRDKRSTFDIDEKECKEKNKDKDTPLHEMKIQKIFSRTQHLQHILERFLACRPTGAAKNHRVVIVSLYPIVKESFQIYTDITETLDIMLDRFTTLKVSECVKVCDIFCRVGKQFDELDMFFCWCKSIGIARSSEYPEIEMITPNKLDIMNHHVKEKIDLDPSRRVKPKADVKNEMEEVEVEEEPKEKGMDSIKALPPAEGVFEEPFKAEQLEEPVLTEEKVKQYEFADLLNLDDDVPSSQELADNLSLTLFVGAALESAPPSASPWDCLTDTSDWETALVESASHLKHHRSSLGGGFDMMLLDSMYQQAETTRSMAIPGYGTTGSPSSVALGSAGRPGMLALPAAPTAGVTRTGNADPFAASLAVAPPSYVQMAELERKQKAVMEEQLMWQQFAIEGMQSQVVPSWVQYNSYMTGFPQTYGNYR